MGLPKYGPGKKKVIRVVDHRSAVTALVPSEPPASTAPAGLIPNGPILSQAASGQATEADRARTIVANSRVGVLSLTMQDSSQSVGFVVPFMVGPAGMPLLGVRAGISQTGARLEGPVSLTVAETALTAGKGGAGGGVTLLGSLKSLAARAELEAALLEYGRRQPADAAAIDRGESGLFSLILSEVLVTSGGGGLVRLSVDDYATASDDPLAAVAPGLVAHLGNDQSGSLVLLCRAYGGQPSTNSAALAGIDQYGMDVVATTTHGREQVRLNFSQPVSSPEEVRRELTTMARGARFKLGVG